MRLPPLVARCGRGHRVCAQGRRSSRAHDSRVPPARRRSESALAGSERPVWASGAPVAGAGWVPGSNRAKTYGSELSPIFQTLILGVTGNFPKNDAWLAGTTWYKSLMCW
jgi:hypothetical protein